MLGPVLAIANHTVPIDAAFVLFALPARLRHRLAVAMGGERLWAMRYPPVEWNFLRRWLARIKYALLVTIFNVFPLPKHAGFRESFAYVGASVDRGYSVLVFPEGEITQDGKIGPFRTGIGLLANRLNLPVVSMRLDGLFELQQARRRNLRFGQVRITIGAPVTFSPDAEPEQITRALEMRVCELGLRKV